jgi:hypothetical protein
MSAAAFSSRNRGSDIPFRLLVSFKQKAAYSTKVRKKFPLNGEVRT